METTAERIDRVASEHGWTKATACASHLWAEYTKPERVVFVMFSSRGGVSYLSTDRIHTGGKGRYKAERAIAELSR